MPVEDGSPDSRRKFTVVKLDEFEII